MVVMDDQSSNAGAAAPVIRSSELLGFAPDARVLIVNADDFGMYHAINAAVVQSIEHGIASSCSLMVPCPWALHAMQLLRERPEIPFGIHLTLVCDSHHYRWGPLTARHEVPSLLDPEGELFTPAGIPELLARARLDEVEVEFRAQVEAVIGAGLRPTHLDWHCLADGGRADIFDVTLALADEYGIAVRAWLEPARQKRRAGGCRWSATTSRGSVRPTTNFWPPGGPEEEGITVIGWSTLLEQWQHPPGTAPAR
jgi:predicted glycoside hydrolase/deacetylase ChbG (UPF0249 family)